MGKKRLGVLEEGDIINAVIEMMLAGDSRSEIVKKLLFMFPQKLNEEQAIRKYIQAKDSLAERVSTSGQDVIALHVKWYETLMKKFESVGSTAGVNMAVRQKEKILGLLKEEKIVKIENEVNITVQKSPEYDESKLTPDERKRLDRYLKLVTAKNDNP